MAEVSSSGQGFRDRRMSDRLLLASQPQETELSAKFEIKKSTNGKFMFNLKAGNHEVILTSELYKSKQAAEGGIASVQKNAAADDRYQRKVAKDQSPYFLLLAANGEVIGKSEMYSSAAAMENGVASVKKNAPQAPTKDLTKP